MTTKILSPGSMAQSTSRAQSESREMLRQIGNPTLRALKPTLMTYDAQDGATVLRFAVGGTDGRYIRKVEITYRRGLDDYAVRGLRFSLAMGPQGTTLSDDERYEIEGVYAEQLAATVVAAAKAAGARPRL